MRTNESFDLSKLHSVIIFIIRRSQATLAPITIFTSSYQKYMESLNTEKCFTFHSVVKRSVTEHQLTSCEVNKGQTIIIITIIIRLLRLTSVVVDENNIEKN